MVSWSQSLLNMGASMLPPVVEKAVGLKQEVCNAVSMSKQTTEGDKKVGVVAVFQENRAEKNRRNIRSRRAVRFILKNGTPELKERAKKRLEKEAAARVKNVENVGATIGLAVPAAVLVTQIGLTPARLAQMPSNGSRLQSAKNIAAASTPAIVATAKYVIGPIVTTAAMTTATSVIVPLAPVALVGAVGATGVIAVFGGTVAAGALGIALVRDAVTGNLPGR